MSDIVVARIGKPHGIKGESTVQLHVHEPEEYLYVGAQIATDPADRGPLTIRSVRVHNGVWLLAFDGIPDRNGSEALRGTHLVAEEVADDEVYDESDLVGLEVRDTDGTAVGVVAGLTIGAAQDLLDVTTNAGQLVRIPFVEQLVPVVDLDARYVSVDAPEGLFGLTVE